MKHDKAAQATPTGECEPAKNPYKNAISVKWSLPTAASFGFYK